MKPGGSLADYGDHGGNYSGSIEHFREAPNIRNSGGGHAVHLTD